MSVAELGLDVLHGNFSHAWSRIQDWWDSAPASLKALLAKSKTDAGKIAQGLCETAAKDIVTGGILNTDAYVKAATDIFAQVVSQGMAIELPDIFAFLNAAVSYLIAGNPIGASDVPTEPTVDTDAAQAVS